MIRPCSFVVRDEMSCCGKEQTRSAPFEEIHYLDCRSGFCDARIREEELDQKYCHPWLLGWKSCLPERSEGSAGFLASNCVARDGLIASGGQIRALPR